MDTETTYNQALDYLYSFVDYSLKKSAELAKAEFNLERMHQLLAALGDPHKQYPVIHVAGTKGKGSTSALCAAGLQAAGFKTGLYTSPHLQDYAERIQVDGQPVPHAGLVELVDRVRPAVDAIPKLTTFEITTALAFLYFAAQQVDAAVIEVGLGGRLDATNVVTPRVSVITSLSYDHMAVLGNTLTQIAGEKAGIIKEGVPVVSSPQVDEALAVLEKVAAERHAPLTLVGRDLVYRERVHSLDGQEISLRPAGAAAQDQKSVILRIPLLGKHQQGNAATAYAALKASGLEVSDAAIARGFARVVWPCRFEVVRREPPVILDSAHNLDSFEKLAETLKDYYPGRRAVLLFGASEDKDVPGMLLALLPHLALVIVAKADHPRATDPVQLAGIARGLGLQTEVAVSVEAALRRALQLAETERWLVLSAGSMFVTAEVRSAWQKMKKRRYDTNRPSRG
jgi:dihydrofolate synthase/folylpolyglutamate synthase